MPATLPAGSVAVVLGTRPEIIKLAPILRLLGDSAVIIHTGQHYDDLLSNVFFEGLGLDEPAARLSIGGVSREEQIEAGTEGLADLLSALDPQWVIAQGDTNSVAAAALAAESIGMPFAHVEAGLRSYDDRMPEEHNRIIADRRSTLLFAPTRTNVDNLAAEGISSGVHLTGNTIVDAVQQLLPTPDERVTILRSLGLRPGRYVLSTIHRPENVDEPDRLSSVLDALGSIDSEIVLPIHPRTSGAIARFGFTVPSNATTIAPVGYREFLALGAESAVVVSDSGGVQEEVSIYKRPLIVVRRSTERPEVIGSFADRIELGPAISEAANRLLSDPDSVTQRLAAIESPYGTGDAAARIVQLLG